MKRDPRGARSTSDRAGIGFERQRAALVRILEMKKAETRQEPPPFAVLSGEPGGTPPIGKPEIWAGRPRIN